MERLEGGEYSQLRQLIKQIGYNDYDRFDLATVTSAPPNLRIKIDGWPVELEADDLVVARHLLRHTRTVTLTGGTVTGDMTKYTHYHDVGDGTTSTDTHAHILTSLTVTSGMLTFEDELKVGDRVIVASANDGQRYYILDWAEVLT